MGANINKNFSNFAFTLSEVIITLGIIGVVAAITIPPLNNQFQKQQYTIALKKFCTEFDQALMELALDYKCTGDLSCTGLFSSSSSEALFGAALIKHFNFTKDCGVTPGGGCFPSIINDSYDGSGSNINIDNYSTYKFVTADGMSISASIGIGTSILRDCQTNNSNSGSGYMSELCGFVIVDINGFKSPNRSGRDVFYFYITNSKGPQLYPYDGTDDSRNGWWKSPTERCKSGQVYGAPCTGRIIENGWIMDY